MQTPEEYRKNPIWKTDLSKRPSELVCESVNELAKLRGRMEDIKRGYPERKREMEYIENYFTMGIIAMNTLNKDIIKSEIRNDDIIRGKSLPFASRGIGSQSVGCFVCGVSGLNSNIAAFVDSKENGEEIVSWFPKGAYLDFRPNEPNWIQVKIGACAKHIENLKMLDKVTSVHKVIREIDVSDASQLGF